MADALKPCVRCGATWKNTVDLTGWVIDHRVGCYLRGYGCFIDRTEAGRIEAWNVRAEQVVVAQEAEPYCEGANTYYPLTAKEYAGVYKGWIAERDDLRRKLDTMTHRLGATVLRFRVSSHIDTQDICDEIDAALGEIEQPETLTDKLVRTSRKWQESEHSDPFPKKAPCPAPTDDDTATPPVSGVFPNATELDAVGLFEHVCRHCGISTIFKSGHALGVCQSCGKSDGDELDGSGDEPDWTQLDALIFHGRQGEGGGDLYAKAILWLRDELAKKADKGHEHYGNPRLGGGA